MSKQVRWEEQSPAARGAVVTLAVLDAALRAWSLADLARRPEEQVRGPKPLWALALSLVNSAGALPAIYLAWGRHNR